MLLVKLLPKIDEVVVVGLVEVVVVVVVAVESAGFDPNKEEV